MKLYSRLGTTTVSHPDFGTFDADEHGAIDVPEAFGVTLHRTFINGRQAWEDEPQRHARLLAEESERRKDPATLLAAVEALAAQVAQPAPRRRTKAAP